MEIFDRLRQFQNLSHLSDHQVDQLVHCTSRARYQKGSFILKEGDLTHDIYLIDIGEIEIQRNTPYGLYTLASLKTSDVFGETSFVDQSARSGDAVVMAETSLFTVSHGALSTLIEEDQRFTLALYWTLWKSLSHKLRKTNERLAQFFSKGSAPTSEKETFESKAEGIQVGIGTKRDLFREQKLSAMEINFLATLSKELKFGPGEDIFREGDDGHQMYVVLEGRVMISKEIIGAGEEALAFLERGDYFGEMALIDQQPRSADAKAHTDGAVILSISEEVVEGLLDIQKVSSLRLLKILCALVAKRLREIDDKLVSWFIFNAGSGDSLDIPS